jgi:hypothetical protein
MVQNYVNIYNYNYSIFQKEKYTYIYVYNNYYSCFIKINKKIEVNIQSSNKITLKSCNLKSINAFLYQFLTCNFTKIRFVGKGYKIKKNCSNNIFLLFNRSHMTNVWYKNIILRKYKKYKIYIRHIAAWSIVQNILSIRPVNIFTKKGLRTSRQIIYKKKGKK